jgi:hypothetical protein
MKPVKLHAELRHCEWDAIPCSCGGFHDNVVEEMPVFYSGRNFDTVADPEWRDKMCELYSPARYIADCIAMTRNIAAMWDLVSVTLDGIDVTREVNEAWLRWYVCRRAEFATM